MNSVFNGVELLHKNFNWDDKQYLDYADWLRVRTLELFPIDPKHERSAYQCIKNIRDGKVVLTQQEEGMEIEQFILPHCEDFLKEEPKEKEEELLKIN